MKIKTNELTGPALDWAVARVSNMPPPYFDDDGRAPRFSADWAQGGPIIEREGIRLHRGITNLWWAATESDPHRPVSGPTPLVAAMRVYVLSRVGDEIDVPEELI